MSDWSDEVRARLESIDFGIQGGTLAGRDIRAALAEIERLLEIKVYAEKAYEELRADLTAKIERLEHELDDAKRSRDDAIGNAIRA